MQQQVSLKPYNTFGIDANCSRFVRVEEVSQVIDLIGQGIFKNDFLILGGGSNMLLLDDYTGTVVKNNILGFEIVSESDTDVVLEIGAGMNWHETVIRCVNQGWWGIENLSLIPGNCGAAPMQNIGAYGVEIKDCLVDVRFVHLSSGSLEVLKNEDCHFGYRESIFKKELKNKVLITSIRIRLSKKPNRHLEYGAIKDQLEVMNASNPPTIKEISDAVIAIRQSKLPDPNELGNSGSFFKNPVIPNEQATKLKQRFPELRSYPAGEGKTKLAAGWLIEQAGWKGKRIGNTGCHKNQALVLVNYGGATGKEIWDHAHRVIESVNEMYGIKLEPEVNIISNEA